MLQLYIYSTIIPAARTMKRCRRITMNINDLCDYIILKVTSSDESLSNLKLQKLMYYAQAWYLAFYNKPLSPSNFQAWIHGPVNREIYNRFAGAKTLYSEIGPPDIKSDLNFMAFSNEILQHIDHILDSYAKFSGAQLEEMTHREAPWVNARSGYTSAQRCEVEIKNEDMAAFYGDRLG